MTRCGSNASSAEHFYQNKEENEGGDEGAAAALQRSARSSEDFQRLHKSVAGGTPEVWETNSPVQKIIERETVPLGVHVDVDGAPQDKG